MAVARPGQTALYYHGGRYIRQLAGAGRVNSLLEVTGCVSLTGLYICHGRGESGLYSVCMHL